MQVKLYFETLSKGMHAKLNSRYVPRKPARIYSDVPSLLKTNHATNSGSGPHENTVGRTSDLEIIG